MGNFLAGPGSIKVTVCVPDGTTRELAAFKAYFTAERNRAKTLPQATTRGLDRRESAARRSMWARQKEELRRAGELVDSSRALITGGLVRVITERGWDPQQLASVPHQAHGRWIGDSEYGWAERISVELPADLVNLAKAGCWHVSREATNALHQWRQRNPKARPTRRMNPRCDPEQQAEYERLAAQILTPGAIWRAAVEAGMTIARGRSG
ncbi:hypothetical protein ACFV0B_20665 [Streptomyces xanthophaeus]|uniref:hypothetical protein n=1 Tax=Streptomyces xanthophaeus TaxID=67385 RepID=UPI00368679EF